jgi:hypothetical protein
MISKKRGLKPSERDDFDFLIFLGDVSEEGYE